MGSGIVMCQCACMWLLCVLAAISELIEMSPQSLLSLLCPRSPLFILLSLTFSSPLSFPSSLLSFPFLLLPPPPPSHSPPPPFLLLPIRLSFPSRSCLNSPLFPLFCFLLTAQADANVDCRDSSGQTPLHEAAHRGSTFIVSLLIAAGQLSANTLLTAYDNYFLHPPIQAVTLLSGM